MTKEELKIQVEESFVNTEKFLQETGSVVPMIEVLFVNEEGKKEGMAVNLVEDRQLRDKFVKGLGLIFSFLKHIKKVQDVHCAIMSSEAWFSTPSKDGFKMLPSQDPNKREMLITFGKTADGANAFRAKEMFSVEVKGKRHFTLSDVPEMEKNVSEADSGVLSQFFSGFISSSNDSSHSRMLQASADLFKGMTLQECFERSIKVLTQQVGGLESELIKLKK